MTDTTPVLTSIDVPTRVLQRGFWLYVLELRIDGETWHYVGRTGDNGHLTASDPFSRLAMHVQTRLGHGKVNTFNQLGHRKALPPVSGWQMESCVFHSYGPIFHEEIKDDSERKDRHLAKRLKIAPLENHLNRAMRAASYNVLNNAGRDKKYDQKIWLGIHAAFAAKFDRL